MRLNDHHHTIRIIADDPHGEYTAGMVNRPGGVATTIWDPYRLTDTIIGLGANQREADDRIDAAWDALFGGLAGFDRLDQAGFYRRHDLILLSGTREDILKWARELHDRIADGPKGGDDDTFDYWPSALDILNTIATDLRERELMRVCHELRERFNDEGLLEG